MFANVFNITVYLTEHTWKSQNGLYKQLRPGKISAGAALAICSSFSCNQKIREGEGKFNKFGQPVLRQQLASVGCQVTRARSYLFQVFFLL